MKVKLSKLWGVVKREWPLEVSVSIFLAVCLFLLLYRLNGLLPGQSPAEATTIAITDTLPGLFSDILFWPYYMLVYVMRTVISDPVLAARLVSAGLGFTATFSLFLMIRRWFSSNVAIVGTTIFIANSWFLQTARSGEPDILIPATLISIWAVALWLINRPKKLLPGVVLALLLLSAVFLPVLPMLVILIGLVGLLRWKSLPKMLKKNQLYIFITTIIVLVSFVIVGLVQNYDQTAAILGIPGSVPTPGDLLNGFVDTLAAIFWRAPLNPAKWLGDLPLLDIFGVVMFTLGVYHHERNFGGRRSLILFGTLFLTLILLILNGGVEYAGFAAMMPIIAIFIISGAQEFLQIWNKVFPRNPLTHILAALVLAILVTTSSLYQLNRYYVAWPGSPETAEAFDSRPR
ncbi:MAG: hypothetical protein AAF413_00630 [Patescibacteria group bacterium]